MKIKNIIRKWLGVENVDVEKIKLEIYQSNRKRIEEAFENFIEGYNYLGCGRSENNFYRVVEKHMPNVHNLVKMHFSDFLEQEKVLDEIVERIRRKQL